MDRKTAFKLGFMAKAAELGVDPESLFDNVYNTCDTVTDTLIKSGQGTGDGLLMFLNNALKLGVGAVQTVGTGVKDLIVDWGPPALLIGPTLAGAGLGALTSKMTSPSEQDIDRIKQLELSKAYTEAAARLQQAKLREKRKRDARLGGIDVK